MKEMKFRKMKEGYLENKLVQQRKVAKRVQDSFECANLSECPEGFELVKEMLICNEKLGVGSLLREVFSDYFRGGVKWLGIAITFILGIMSTKITDNSVECGNIIVSIIGLMIIGYVVDVVREGAEVRIEKLTIRILDEMSYERYRFLIDYEKNNKIDGEQK